MTTTKATADEEGSHARSQPEMSSTPENKPSGPSARELRDLLAVIPTKILATLTVENRIEYAAVSYVLFWNRAHATEEVTHDELQAQSNEILEQIRGVGVDDGAFNRLLASLEEWGVVVPRLNPRRIRSIDDWRRRPYNYAIQDEGFRLYQMLRHGHARHTVGTAATQGKDYARRIQQGIQELKKALESIEEEQVKGSTRRDRLRQAYRDLRHIFAEELRPFAEFLSRLNASLINFGNEPGIDFARLRNVVDWLDSYVDDTLTYIRDRGDEIVVAVRDLLANHTELLADGHELERADVNPLDPPTELTHPAAHNMAWDLIHFFEAEGDLDEHAGRIRASTNQTAQRLGEHYRRLADSNQVTQLLRLRIGEILVVDDEHERRLDDVMAWVNRLYAPTLMQWAPRIGSFSAQGKPPQPGKYRDARRPPILDIPVAKLEGDGTSPQPFDIDALERLNDFVAHRILKGRSQARLRDLEIQTIDDFSRLLDAVKNDNVVLGASISKWFTFRFEDPRGHPADPLDVITWIGDDGTYTGQDLVVRAGERNEPVPISVEAKTT